MRIIIDMNLAPKWAAFLGGEGFEAAHWSNVGPVNALDTTIMAYALAESAIVLTSDLDFGAILAATGGNAPSVMQIRAGDVSVSAIGLQVVAALRQSAQLLADGALVTLTPDKVRLTILPIRGLGK
jgi:predicted nuclease of predicted toxin-antitoxin system